MTQKWLWSLGALAVGSLMAPMAAWASNCSSLDDCWGSAGAAAAAAAAAGALAGTNKRKRKKPPPPQQKPDPCAGERRAVLEAQSRVDTYTEQLKDYGKELEGLKRPADELIARANELAPAAQREVAEEALEALFEKLADLVTHLVAPEIAAAKDVIDLATEPSGAIPGMEYVNFFNELVGYFKLMQGGLDNVAQFADEHDLVTTKRFVETMRELQQLAARGSQLGNRMDTVRVELKGWEDKLQQAKAALEACEAAHAAA